MSPDVSPVRFCEALAPETINFSIAAAIGVSLCPREPASSKFCRFLVVSFWYSWGPQDVELL